MTVPQQQPVRKQPPGRIAARAAARRPEPITTGAAAAAPAAAAASPEPPGGTPNAAPQPAPARLRVRALTREEAAEALLQEQGNDSGTLVRHWSARADIHAHRLEVSVLPVSACIRCWPGAPPEQQGTLSLLGCHSRTLYVVCATPCAHAVYEGGARLDAAYCPFWKHLFILHVCVLFNRPGHWLCMCSDFHYHHQPPHQQQALQVLVSVLQNCLVEMCSAVQLCLHSAVLLKFSAGGGVAARTAGLRCARPGSRASSGVRLCFTHSVLLCVTDVGSYAQELAQQLGRPGAAVSAAMDLIKSTLVAANARGGLPAAAARVLPARFPPAGKDVWFN